MAKESTLVRKVIDELDSWPNTRAVKIHGSMFGRVGDPDIWGCRHGRMFVLEGKLPGKHPRVIQKIELKRWEKAGATTGWFTTFEEAIEIVRAIPVDPSS